jgi:hypothetical protein
MNLHGRPATLMTAVVFVFTGCGSQVTPTTGAASAIHTTHGKSWMKPGTSSGELVYVSSPTTDDVYVFAYPSGQLVGTLTGFSDPTGLCSDANGNVWVSNVDQGTLVEYAHGGTSVIATLDDDGRPENCSVDPTTGNLAVANFGYSIAVYQDAQGMPTYYSTDGLISFIYAITYDGSGNVYVAGFRRHSGWLPKGSSKVAKFELIPNPRSHGSFEWDGQYLAVLTKTKTPEDQVTRYKLSAHMGKMVGSAPLNLLSHDAQFWIHDSGLVAADADAGNVYFYKYPAGGRPTHTIAGLEDPLGVTISVAPSGTRTRH